MPSANLSFRTPKASLAQIRSRDVKGVDNPGATAKRDLFRFYDLLAEGLTGVKDVSPEEAVVLIYYVGTYDGVATVDNIQRAGEVLEDYPIGLVEDFDRAKVSLGLKYQGWPLVTQYAAWDAAERYQVISKTERGDVSLGMALHRVGLHSYDLSPEELAHVERTPAWESVRLPGIYLRTAEEDSTDE